MPNDEPSDGEVEKRFLFDLFEGLQENGTLDDSIPRPAFGLGAAFEELEKVVRDGHRITPLRVR